MIIQFLDKFITNGTKGGKLAADELVAQVLEYLRGFVPGVDKLEVVVKAFANLEGLATSLVRDGRLKSVGELREFTKGFNSRLPFFDLVDIGPEKESADQKIRGIDAGILLSRLHLLTV